MATRTNLCVNPSIEIDLAEFAPYDANTTLTRDTTQFRTGVASVKSTVNLATTWHGPAIFIDGLTVGQTYTASAYARNSSGTNVVSVWAGGTAGDPVTLDSTWKRVSKTFVATLATNQGIMFLDSSGSLGDSFFIDNILVEYTDIVRDYFDGSFPFSSWSGTPYASASTWTFSPFDVKLWDSGSKFDIKLKQPTYLNPATEFWGFLSLQPPDEYVGGYARYLDAHDPLSYPGSGTAWADLSGSGYSATLTNGPTYSTSGSGSIDFDGVDDYADISNVGITHGTSNFTYSCWVNHDTVQYGSYFENGSWTGSLLLRQESTTTVSLYSMGTGFGTWAWTPAAGTWYHLTWTRVSNNVLFYVNGVLNGTLAFGTSLNIIPSTAILRIGSSQHAVQCFNGKMSAALVYNSALTAYQVMQNFNRTKSRYGY